MSLLIAELEAFDGVVVVVVVVENIRTYVENVEGAGSNSVLMKGCAAYQAVAQVVAQIERL